MILLFIFLVLAIACGILFARALPYLIAGGFLLYVISQVVPNSPQPASSDQTAAPSPAQAPPEPNQLTYRHHPRFAAATAMATAAVASLPTGPVTMYDKGLADRAAWENWFNGLQGDFKTGAFFWAGQRSLPHPGSCSDMNTDFNNGCTAAKERLATPDALRRSEPDYKQGWNAYGSPPPTDAPIPLHARVPTTSRDCTTSHYGCCPGLRSVSRSTQPCPPPTALLTEEHAARLGKKEMHAAATVQESGDTSEKSGDGSEKGCNFVQSCVFLHGLQQRVDIHNSPAPKRAAMKSARIRDSS